MGQKFVYILLITAVLFFSPDLVFADDWMAPSQFEIHSEDGSKFFQFDPGALDSSNPFATAAVYENANPPKPIYEVENLRSWAYENNFYFTEDFMHFAFMPSPDFDIAIEFYSEGVLVKTYNIKDLVSRHSKIEYSTSSAWWKNSDAEVVRDSDRLTITTIDNITYVFDIATGDIVEKHGVSNNIWISIIIFVIAVVAGIYISRVIIKKKKGLSS